MCTDLILLSNSLFCSCNKVNTLLVSTLFFVVNSKSCCKEQQIENQTEKTNVFNEGLKEFTTQRDELLKTAQTLIEEAKTALGYRYFVLVTRLIPCWFQLYFSLLILNLVVSYLKFQKILVFSLQVQIIHH
jgi:hypothetical protein